MEDAAADGDRHVGRRQIRTDVDRAHRQMELARVQRDEEGCAAARPPEALPIFLLPVVEAEAEPAEVDRRHLPFRANRHRNREHGDDGTDKDVGTPKGAPYDR